MKAIIGIKQNMSQAFAEDGNFVPVTYVSFGDVCVAGIKTMERDGYVAIVYGYGKKKKPTKAEVGKFKELGFVPQNAIEVRMDAGELKVGDKISPSIFEVNQKVDITGQTKGKGFQGVVKRYHFAGGPRTHGASDRERHGGSIGQRTTPGRVFKGKKMPGHMGNVTRTVKLKVVMVDAENNLLALKGAVPGNSGSLVVIKSNK